MAPEEWTPEPGFLMSRQSCFPVTVLPRSPIQAANVRWEDLSDTVTSHLPEALALLHDLEL